MSSSSTTPITTWRYLDDFLTFSPCTRRPPLSFGPQPLAHASRSRHQANHHVPLPLRARG
eukprot:scaffold210936_cov44-Tisochrysis_lutea.AAC.1